MRYQSAVVRMHCDSLLSLALTSSCTQLELSQYGWVRSSQLVRVTGAHNCLGVRREPSHAPASSPRSRLRCRLNVTSASAAACTLPCVRKKVVWNQTRHTSKAQVTQDGDGKGGYGVDMGREGGALSRHNLRVFLDFVDGAVQDSEEGFRPILCRVALPTKGHARQQGRGKSKRLRRRAEVMPRHGPRLGENYGAQHRIIPQLATSTIYSRVVRL